MSRNNHLVALPADSPHRKAIERLLGMASHEVRCGALLPYGNCYWNIDGLVRAHGGSMALGWLLLWWPGRMVEAMHHAVWRKPDGELFDPSGGEDGAQRVLFCEDSSVAVDLTIPVYIPNRRLLLSPHAALASLDRLLEQELDLAREIAGQARRDGAVFTSGKPLKVRLSKETAGRMRKLKHARDTAFAKCAALSDAEL